MTVKVTRFLTWQEKNELEDLAISQGWYRNDRRMFTPGMAWETPWVYAPPGHSYRDSGKYIMFPAPPADPTLKNYLSVQYWRDHAAHRCPIEVVCPNGISWEVDRKSSNGNGWAVTGDPLHLTCTPSIVVPGYHGYLRNGEFTANMDDPKNPDGVYPY